ncbi:MAG: aminotransferase class I/II-fold pyridoxal phosphate-dependent enzyme [Legionella sp.]|jgi:aspartate/methionine/tyrosine aminotransferase
MNAVLNTLTDFEVSGLHSNFCLADGHAYQDLHPSFKEIIQNLPQLWNDAAQLSIPEAELMFNKTFARFINSPILNQYPHFRICPTASNSIDLIGAVLNHLQLSAVLIEPAFDNLALLVRRRGVNLSSINDKDLYTAAESNTLDERFPHLKDFGALFIVHPNNPTGLIVSEQAFKNLVDFCKRHQIVMVVDNCFRIYRRTSFDDYKILVDSSISFMAFEDTGKVWPTQDLKASLVYFSEDLSSLFNEIYNEVYLCVSNFSLKIIASFYDETAKSGVQNTIWDIVDSRRALVRKLIEDSDFRIPQIATNSKLPVEWLTYKHSDKNDLIICRELKQMNLAVLPGRHFYWNSQDNTEHQKFIRVSLMKREVIFQTGLTILSNYMKQTMTRLAAAI